jgi:hypothetical protein
MPEAGGWRLAFVTNRSSEVDAGPRTTQPDRSWPLSPGPCSDSGPGGGRISSCLGVTAAAVRGRPHSVFLPSLTACRSGPKPSDLLDTSAHDAGGPLGDPVRVTRPSARVGLAITSMLVVLAVTHAPAAQADPRIAANDNRRAAGVLRDGVLTLDLEIVEARWGHAGHSAGRVVRREDDTAARRHVHLPHALARRAAAGDGHVRRDARARSGAAARSGEPTRPSIAPAATASAARTSRSRWPSEGTWSPRSARCPRTSSCRSGSRSSRSPAGVGVRDARRDEQRQRGRSRRGARLSARALPARRLRLPGAASCHPAR